MTQERHDTKSENERQYHVVDQMLAMHSLLRDRLKQRAFLLSTLLIAVSLFLCVFAFVGDNLLQSIRLDPAMTRFLIGLGSVVVLVLSIAEFRADWGSAAARHGEAVTRLAALKAQYRELFGGTEISDPERNESLTTKYNKAMSSLIPIPERQFNALKVAYEFKRLLSERISQCPKTPCWFLRLQIRLEGIREARQMAKERRKGQQHNETKTT